MPEEQAQSIADKYNLPLEQVERYYRECEESVDNPEENYDQVVGCVKNRAKKASKDNATEAAKEHM